MGETERLVGEAGGDQVCKELKQVCEGLERV